MKINKSKDQFLLEDVRITWTHIVKPDANYNKYGFGLLFTKGDQQFEELGKYINLTCIKSMKTYLESRLINVTDQDEKERLTKLLEEGKNDWYITVRSNFPIKVLDGKCQPIDDISNIDLQKSTINVQIKTKYNEKYRKWSIFPMGVQVVKLVERQGNSMFEMVGNNDDVEEELPF